MNDIANYKKIKMNEIDDFKKKILGKGLSSAVNKINEDIKNMSKSSLSNMNLPQYNARIRLPSAEEMNEYQSAATLMKTLSDEAIAWKSELKKDQHPTIIAILPSGARIHVHALSQVSFHGIKINGVTDNNENCSLFAHQSTVQILCLAQEKCKEPSSNPIGFHWGDINIEV